MNTFIVKLFSPDSHTFFDKVLSVLVNGLEGQLMVLANHAPYLIYLHSGKIIIKIHNQKDEEAIIENGILKVSVNKCSIVTGRFQLCDEKRG